ncbi:MAG: hypothetical protein IKC65_07130 [Lentisphaeria bacterium]|nr:hypothetical protein [Lentisphaeria bacterium]
MRPFISIVKLTFRHALRSHIFQLLLGVLLFAVLFIPGTVGAGTASDFIKVSLLYSLWAVSIILALSSIWLGCFVMTTDIDSYQLHMIVAKPVSRVVIWLGKWTGVNLINLILLLGSGLLIYSIILYRFNNGDFPADEREKIRNEVMVGRRVYPAMRPDYGLLSREALKRRILRLQAQGANVDLSPASQEKMLKDVLREVVSGDSELKAGQRKVWAFPDLPAGLNEPIYLRYRPYVGKVASEDQRMTRLMIYAGVPRQKEQKQNSSVFSGDPRANYDIFMIALAEKPEQVMSGEFHEKMLRPEWKVVTPDNRVVISIENVDPGRGTLFFQPADGPKLLIKAAGFFENYMRAILVIALELLILSGFACSFGGCMSMPVAVFVEIGYLLFGSFSVYMTGLTYRSGAADRFGVFIAKLLLVVVIPLQAFDVTGSVANGELLEWSFIWRLVWYYLLCRALPLFLLCIWIYRKRELGLIIRK